MEITVIYDNSPGEMGWKSGWGWSVLLGRDLLFDTGSDPEEFMENLRKAVAPSSVKEMVVSHGHWDHTAGLFPLVRQSPGIKVYVGEGFSHKFEEELKRKGAEVIRGNGWREIRPGIWIGPELPGPVPEQFLVVEGRERVLLVGGCSHPGIEKFAELTGEKFQKPVVIMGGFHLFSAPEEKIRRVAETLKAAGVVMALPAHCSGERTLEIFGEYFPVKGTGSGLRLELP